VDTFTHALVGASLAVAARPQRAKLTRHECAWLGAVAASVPDIDFIGFLIDPLRFLAHWHQGPTHSLVLLPLWALLLGAAFAGLSKRRDLLPAAALVSAGGLASHVALDAVTAYGVAALYPLSSRRFALSTTFVIDPYLSTIAVVALALSLHRGTRLAAVGGLALIGLYIGMQASLQQRALEVGRVAARAAGLAPGPIYALAQPFSPFYWKLIHAEDTAFHETYLNLVGHPPLVPPWPGLRWLHAINAAYRAPPELRWHARPRFGVQAEHRALAGQLWNAPRFAAFRRFAAYPVVSRIDERDGAVACVWFTDLRYDLPALPDTFRYGWCREHADAPWALYRLRYFSDDARQPLGR
jgi:inner membrane protein